MTGRKRKGRGTKNVPLLLIALPGLAYLLINNYIPMFGIFLAFKSYDFSKGVFGSPWCGFDNFKFLFKTKDALIMTRNTILYNFAFIVIGTALGIFVAILLTEIVKSVCTLSNRSYMYGITHDRTRISPASVSRNACSSRPECFKS